MSRLTSPKVRLALIVNGLYFISLFTPPARQGTPPRLSARPSKSGDFSVPAPKRAPVYVTLPPPSGSSKATALANTEFDQLDIYLPNDLTLLERPGYRLLLSPTLTTKASNPVAPNTVLLRFVSFSKERTYSDASWLTITADGRYVWYEDLGSRPVGDATFQSETESSGEVVRAVGVNLPYEKFVETISAREVLIQFWGERIKLNADQIEALRDMHRRLPPPPVELNSR